eukprot:scaffold1474_cov256-Pinguiococcus_pyrenoidosus.AAC.16
MKELFRGSSSFQGVRHRTALPSPSAFHSGTRSCRNQPVTPSARVKQSPWQGVARGALPGAIKLRPACPTRGRRSLGLRRRCRRRPGTLISTPARQLQRAARTGRSRASLPAPPR